VPPVEFLFGQESLAPNVVLDLVHLVMLQLLLEFNEQKNKKQVNWLIVIIVYNNFMFPSTESRQQNFVLESAWH
jgi:hypothetical protein